MPKKSGPKPGAKIKPLSDRDKWNAGKKSRGLDDDTVFEVVRGILRPKKK